MKLKPPTNVHSASRARNQNDGFSSAGCRNWTEVMTFSPAPQNLCFTFIIFHIVKWKHALPLHSIQNRTIPKDLLL